MFDQTANQNYGAPQMGGYQFNGYQPQQIPKVMNVLTNEEIKELQQSTSQFSLGLTSKEILQGACNHRSPDGTQDTLVFDQNTGIARCTICGYEFRPIEADTSYETIKDAADRLVDILQTIKIMYTELPAGAAREYFQIIPLIGKIPQLFEFAAKNFAKHEYNAWSYQNHNMGGAAMLQNLNNIFGASMQPMNPQFNPYAGQPQQPVGYPNPVMQGNAFGYPGASMAPQQGYMPMNQGFQYTPNQPVNNQVAPTVAAPQAPAPAVDPAAATDTVTQKVSV